MVRFWNNFRSRLAFLVILGVLPPIGLILHVWLEQRQLASTHAQDIAQRVASHFATNQRITIEMTRTLLGDLAQHPAAKSLDLIACASLFETFFRNRPFLMYANIGIIDLQGNVVSSIVPPSAQTNLADRPYFQETLRTGDLSAGRYQIGRITGKKSICFGYPVKDDAGLVHAVIFAALDLEWIREIAKTSNIPEGATLTFVDLEGTVLFRHPDPQKWEGFIAPEIEIVKTVLSGGEGVTEAEGIDGIRKYYAYLPVGQNPRIGYVYVGIPKLGIISSANEMLVRNLSWLGVTVLAGLFAAWFLAYVFIVRRLDTLVNASQRIAAGDLSVRTGLTSDHGEIGELGAAFDGMAESLRERENQRRNVEESLLKEKVFIDTAVDSLPGIFYLFNGKGRFLKWNRNFEKVSGYTAKEIADMNPVDFFEGEEKSLLQNTIQNVLSKGESSVEAYFVSKTGDRIPYLFSGKLVNLGDEDCVIGMGIDITERTLFENTFRLEKQKFETLCEQAPFAMILLGQDGAFKYVNPKFEEMFGYSQEEVPNGKEWFRKAFPNDAHRREAIGTWIQDLENADKVPLRERIYSVTCKDGTRKAIHFRPVLMDSGDQLITCEDITVRSRFEEELQLEREQLLSIFDSIGAIVHVVDPMTYKILFMNKYACDLYGSDGIGQACYEVFHGHDSPCLYCPNDVVLELGGKPHSCEYYRKRFDRYFAATSRAIKWPDGREVKLEFSFDVTEQKLTQQQCSISEQKYRSLFEESIDGIFITERNGVLIDANQSFLDLFGYNRDEMIGRSILMTYVDPSDRESFQREIEKNGAARDYPLKLFKKDGTLMDCLINGSVRLSDDGTILGYRGIIRDITAQRALERQLLQAQKMEAIGTLAGGVAHDFNNLLTVILGYCELLLADKRGDDPEFSDLRTIHQTAKRGADLVKRILTFSRKVDTNKLPLDLNREVNKAQELLSRTIPKMISIELHLTDNLNKINADPSQIEQILLNLAVNAKDAMPQTGGALIVGTRNAVLDVEYCRSHTDAKPGDYVILSVSDTGHGMDRKVMEHIFEPFYSTKKPGQGTGLGLSMVYGIVQNHGGWISCYSEPGAGTTFQIYFPAIEPDLKSYVAESADMPASGTETILLVDDEEFIRDVGKKILSRAGYSVITAESGEKAIEIYLKKRAEISLILLDFMMPGMGGKECLDRLLEIDSTVKVIIGTGYSADLAAKELAGHGAKKLLSKPYDVKGTLRIIRDVLDERN
jgi:PAS domain S-box-containing protein